MISGLSVARQNRLITVPEVTFMVPDPDGVPYFRSDVGSDGNGLANPQNWVNHLADGNFSTPEGTALVGDMGTITRTFMPRYRLMELIWRGIAGLPQSDVDIDGGTRRKIVWIDPESQAPSVETVTGYYGLPEASTQLAGGKVVSFNIDVRRSGDGGSAGGNIEYNFNRLLPNIAVPGAAAVNAKFYVLAYDPVADLVLSLDVAGGTGAAPVTITPGEVQTIDLSGDDNPTGGTWDLTILGETITDLAWNISAAGLQAAIRASGADHAESVTVTKTGFVYTVRFPNAAGNVATSVGDASNLTGAGGDTFAITVTTIASPMNAAAIKAAIEALADITTVNVTGSIEDGRFDVEVTNPATTRVAATRTSGARWGVVQNSAGSTADGLTFLEGPYLEPNHAFVYLAADDAARDAIDFSDVPDEYGQGGDAALLATSTGSTFAMADLWKPHYAQTGKVFPTQLVPGARAVTASILVPNDMSDGSDARFIYDTQEGCLATGFWLVRNFACGGYVYREEVYVVRSDAPGFEVDNDVWMRNFPLVRRRNPDGSGSLRITLILPYV